MLVILFVVASLVTGRALGKWTMIGLCGMVLSFWMTFFGGVGLALITPKCAFDLASPPTRDGTSNWNKETPEANGPRYVQLRDGDETFVFHADESRLTYDAAGRARRLDATLRFRTVAMAADPLNGLRTFFRAADGTPVSRRGWRATTTLVQNARTGPAPVEVRLTMQR